MARGQDDDEILQRFANDYADSYQESIDADNQIPIPSAPSEKSALRSLMNPVGIISLLLLLFSSAAIGYLLVDPSGVMKLFKPEARPKAAQTDSKNEDLGVDINLQKAQKNNDSLSSFVPFAGDKTKLENNKSNSKVLANPSTKPTNLFVPSSTSSLTNAPLRTVPSSALPSISVAPLPPALAPVERSSYNVPARRSDDAAPAPSSNQPAPPRNSPSRSSSSTPASVAPSAPAYVSPRSNNAVKYAAPLSSAPATSAETPSSSYRVVVENSYAASAQQVERDAYVRPSDGQVQVGSYRDANAAQQRIEQLRRQGIPARIE